MLPDGVNDPGVPAIPPGGAGKVVIAHLHPGDLATSFAHSLIDRVIFDSASAARHVMGGRLGIISSQAGAGSLHAARNEVTAQFLDRWPAEWLMMIDSDMGFDADSVERLVAAADPVDRPVVGGLCFGAKRAGEGAAHAMRIHFFPTLYSWVENAEPGVGLFDNAYAWDRGKVCRVAGTGAAFLLVHRSVLERIRGSVGDCWFDPYPICRDGDPIPGRWFGEDLSFCKRLLDHDIPLWVHTGVQASHKKEVWVDLGFYDQLRRSASPAVTVVIPVKDRWPMTKRLLAQLVELGGWDDLLVFDNGSSDPDAVEGLAALDQGGPISVFDASGASGIHEMWNAGIEEARVRHRGRSDVVFLNNDLLVGEGFVQRLVGGLRSDPALLAVSGNYDGRPGVGVLPVRGICAGRYDGSGGLAGFAFAVRSEFLEDYRFPEDCAWFFGDNDLVLSVEKAGGWYGVVTDAVVEHLDGGGNTTTGGGATSGQDWLDSLTPRMRDAYEADALAHAEKWAKEQAA